MFIGCVSTPTCKVVGAGAVVKVKLKTSHVIVMRMLFVIDATPG